MFDVNASWNPRTLLNQGFGRSVQAIGWSLFLCVFSLQAQTPPANDAFNSRVPLTGTTNEFDASNQGATRDAGEPLILSKPGGKSVWWVWTAPKAGQAIIDLAGSSFDTLLGVYVGKSFPMSTLAENDNSGASVKTSRVVFDTDAGTDYNIGVDGLGGASGNIHFYLRLVTFPEITLQPLDREITEGQSATFTVEALGQKPLQYQWIRDGQDLPGQTSPTLNLYSVPVGQAGLYLVRVSNSYGKTESQTAQLIVHPAPRIVLQPTSLKLDASLAATFNAYAMGQLPLFYQWYFQGAPIPNATTTNLVLKDVRPKDAGDYYMVVTNRWGSDTSSNATLTVEIHKAVISTQPVDETKDVGDAATFSGLGTGTPPLLYQWFFNRVPIASETDTSLFLSPVATNQAGDYVLRVSNEYGTNDSRAAHLTVVYHLPVVTNQPKDLLVVKGEPASFQVQASGSLPLRYQWLFNGNVLPGETADVLVIPAARTDQDGKYSVRVSNDFGQTTSREARLTVALRPPNDDFVNRIPILETNTVVKGWNNYATHEPKEPTHGGLSPVPTNSVWWSWQAPDQTGLVTVDLKGSSFDTILALYKGNSVGTLTLVKNNDNSVDGGSASKLVFQTEPNMDYAIAVDGVRGAQGNIQLVIGFSTKITPPEITIPPFDFFCFGAFGGWGGGLQGGGCEDATFQVEAVSIAQPITYQWQFQAAGQTTWTDVRGGTNAVLSLHNVSAEQGGTYRVIASNIGGSTTSRVANLTVNPGPGLITIEPLTNSVREGVSVTLKTTARGCAPLTRQWRFNGANLAGANGPNLTLNAVTPLQSGLYDLVVSNPGGSATSQVSRLTVDGVPRIDQQPKGASVRDCDPVSFSVTASSYSKIQYQWLFNGGAVAVATNATYAFPASSVTPGNYWVVVSNPWAAVTSQVATLAVDLLPRIANHPKGKSANEGDTVVLTVVASSCSPLRYDWQFNGVSILDANTNAYAFTASFLTSGDYRVVVSNDWGSVTSQVATVTSANVVVIVTQPSDQRVKVGDPLRLDAEVSSPSPVTFRWLKDDTTAAADANHRVASLGMNTTFEVPIAATNDSGKYQVLVSNTVMGVASRVATVRVVEPPGNDHFTNRFVIRGTNASVTGHNEFATKEPGEPSHARKAGGRSVWWTWTAPEPGTNTIDLSGSRTIAGGTFDTLLGIYEGDRVDGLTEVASDDQSGSDGRTSKVTFPVERGATYQIAVDGNNAAEGAIQLEMRFVVLISPPVITRQPESLAARFGSSVAFSVECKGSPRIFYQWKLEGQDLPGETNAVLRIPSFQSSHEGHYTVVLRNLFGTVVSEVAQLTSGAIIGGMVTDATNGEPIPGVKVTAGDITTYTDAKGNYRLIGVKPGAIHTDFDADSRRVKVHEPVLFRNQSTVAAVILVGTHPSYFDYVNDQIDVPSGQTIGLSFSMSPRLDGMRFVLNWGLNPADLDSTLVTPDGTINYLNRGTTNRSPFAILDHDVTASYGPETITIYQFLPGAYAYFVKKFNFNAIGDLPTSESNVKIYTAGGLYGSRKIPPSGRGRFWHVCNVIVDQDSTNVVWINRLQDEQPDPLAAAPLGLQVGGAGPGLGWPAGPAAAQSAAARPLSIHPLADSGSQTNYLWDFGDGETGNAMEPIHRYRFPGRYTVRLTMSYVHGEKTDRDTMVKEFFITVVNTPPTAAITYPKPNQLFRLGDPIPITIDARDADIEGVVARLEVFEGSRKLREFTHGPFQFNWEGAALGDHVLTARATDEYGTNTLSAAVRVRVLDLSGDVLIVRNAAGPEIDGLVQYLTDLAIPDELTGLPRVAVTRVLDQEGLYYDLVRGFRLIIWNDLGLVPDGLTDNDVLTFATAYEHGIPLYLIGERLLQSEEQLSPAFRARWQDLLSLGIDRKLTVDSTIRRSDPVDRRNELFHGLEGSVEDFSYPGPLEPATLLNTNAEVRATAGAGAALVRCPRFGVLDTFAPRLLSQLFLVTKGAEEDSLDQRRRLFLHGAIWLMRLNECDTFSASASCAEPALSGNIGETNTLRISIDFSGRCPASGITVTNIVAPGLELRAGSILTVPESTNLGICRIDGAVATYQFGQVPPGYTVILECLVTPKWGGSFTNQWSVRANYRPLQKLSQVLEVARPPGADRASLRVELTGAQLGFWVSAVPGLRVVLESSTDLRQWTAVGEATLASSSELLAVHPSPAQTHQFFRLRVLP